jgi:hypothetical protein
VNNSSINYPICLKYSNYYRAQILELIKRKIYAYLRTNQSQSQFYDPEIQSCNELGINSEVKHFDLSKSWRVKKALNVMKGKESMNIDMWFSLRVLKTQGRPRLRALPKACW